MPKIGDIARSIDIGFKDYHKRIWVACADCKMERWVLLRKGRPQSERCHPCGAKIGIKKRDNHRGKKHPRWKGGRQVTTGGYIEVWLSPENPYYSMAGKDGYIYEHRLVMAQQLGRILNSSEEVHHINHDRADNRSENLKLLSKQDHAFGHYGKNELISEVKQLQARIKQLETELRNKS